MTQQYIHTVTGTIHRPGQIVQGQQTHARMSLAAWADLGCEPYTPPPVDPGTTEAQRIAAEHPELPGTVRASLAALQSLVSMGVAIDLSAGLPGWPAIAAAVADAVAAAPDLATMRALWSTQARADGHWRAVEYWCGSPQAAYRLAPELAAIGV